MYHNKLLETLESIKYIGLEVSLSLGWNECVKRLLEVGKITYYAFHNTYSDGEITSQALKNYVFDILVLFVLLYTVEDLASLSQLGMKVLPPSLLFLSSKFLQVKQ